jgi:hypothetical protein
LVFARQITLLANVTLLAKKIWWQKLFFGHIDIKIVKKQ